MMKASRIIGKKRCSIVILAALCALALAVLMCGTAAADRVGFTCPAGCDCFVVGADSRTYYSDFNKTLQFIKPNKDGLEFMVLPGDMEYVLVNKENYTDVELPGLQTYWVVGNHEMDVGDEVNISNLYPSLPNTLYYYDDSLRTTYIAEYNNLYIIVLDEYREDTRGNIPRNGPQFAWLEEHLALLDPAKKIFAFGHEPAYPEHHHLNDSLNQFPRDRDALWSMFDNNSVEAYFCGHTHWYSMNDSMQNVTQVDVGNMRWWGDGNSTLAYVAVNDTTATAYIYSNSTKGMVLDLIDTYDITNDYYTQTTIYVNETGWWRAGGSFNSAVEPINAAETNANDGDSIFIYGGNYSESIQVDGPANLTIIGENVSVVNITGTTAPVFDVRESGTNISRVNLTVPSGDSGIRLHDSQNCYIDVIRVNGGASGVDFYGSGNCSLTNSIITGCSEAGIELQTRPASGHNACYNTIDNCTVLNSTYGRGIYLQDDSHHNMISNCTVANCNRSGIYLKTNASHNTISGNSFNDSIAYYGIRTNAASHNNVTNCYMCNNSKRGLYLFAHADWNNITGCTISNNKDDGIYLYSSSNNTLLNNTASNNTKDGIILYQSNNNTVSKNTVLENHQHGIQLEDGSNNNVSCNWVQNSDDHGFHVGGSSTGNTFKYNNIVTNGIFIETNGSYQWQFYNGLSEGINANYNYWGPNMTSEKINDSIYGEVTYCPFNMSACPCAPIPEASTFFLVASGLTLVVLIRYFYGRKGKKAMRKKMSGF